MDEISTSGIDLDVSVVNRHACNAAQLNTGVSDS